MLDKMYSFVIILCYIPLQSECYAYFCEIISGNCSTLLRSQVGKNLYKPLQWSAPRVPISGFCSD